MENNLEQYINYEIESIFGDIDISTLSDYQKREMIFDYLCSNLTYDWELYFKILLSKISLSCKIPNNFSRNFCLEMENMVTQHKGVCISIASYYKLLLDRVGVYSIVIGTNDGTPVHHILNIVYNYETDSFSFDDVTSMITRHRKKDFCFDYDLDDAHIIHQGNKPIIKKNNSYWLTLPPINYKLGRDRPHFSLIEDKIISIKKQENKKRT